MMQNLSVAFMVAGVVMIGEVVVAIVKWRPEVTRTVLAVRFIFLGVVVGLAAMGE